MKQVEIEAGFFCFFIESVFLSIYLSEARDWRSFNAFMHIYNLFKKLQLKQTLHKNPDCPFHGPLYVQSSGRE